MPTSSPFPPWVVLHVPHDAIEIPAGVRHPFLLDDCALERELLRLTDHHKLALFSGESVGEGTGAKTVRAPVSRRGH